jgi:hypothetical protein
MICSKSVNIHLHTVASHKPFISTGLIKNLEEIVISNTFQIRTNKQYNPLFFLLTTQLRSQATSVPTYSIWAIDWDVCQGKHPREYSA